jgi:hypothetical protein
MLHVQSTPCRSARGRCRSVRRSSVNTCSTHARPKNNRYLRRASCPACRCRSRHRQA